MDPAQQAVTELFIAVDSRDWIRLEEIFAPEVLLDYQSLSGNPPTTLTPQQIGGAWKSMLPGFTHTHHQVGNFIVQPVGDDGNTVHVFCYGTATHYLEHPEGNVWTVVGTYDFKVRRNTTVWQVAEMKFNFRYQDGNTALSKMAQEAVAQKAPTTN